MLKHFLLVLAVCVTVHALPIVDDHVESAVPIDDSVTDYLDAFGNELSFDEHDRELLLLEDKMEDLGDEHYKANLRINHPIPDHDAVDTYPSLLLQEGMEVPNEKDHYIAELKSGTAKNCRMRVELHVAKHCSGVVMGRDLAIIDGFSFIATREGLRACILENEDVITCPGAEPRPVRDLFRFAEMNYEVTANAAAPIWSLDRIDERSGMDRSEFNPNGLTGDGVDVYVVDTGINIGHRDFGGRAKQGFSAIRDGQGSHDCNGHGSHCAGTVGGATYGVAKGVTMYAVRTLGCTGSGSSSGVLRGYDWVLQNRQPGRPAIVSASLGGPRSQSENDAVNNLAANGIVVVVAAGNENKDACTVSPASAGGSAGNIITVAASDNRDRRASFSNYGSCTDLFAPGVDIESASHEGTTRSATMSGTSMACPAVSGAAALYLGANPGKSPADVKRALICKSTPNEISDVRGTPNKMLYVGPGAPCGGSEIPSPPAPTLAPAPQPPTPSVRSCVSVGGAGCQITAQGCPISEFTLTVKCFSPAVTQDFKIRDYSRVTIDGCSSCAVVDGPGFDQDEPAPAPYQPSPYRPPSPPSPPSGGDCEDFFAYSSCVYYQRNGQCGVGATGYKYCAKTCGVCSGGISPSCRDQFTGCAGFCSSSLAREYCAQTCGYCQAEAQSLEDVQEKLNA